MRREEPYNPLAKKNLGKSVADALLDRPVDTLPPGEPFAGAGVYAIYYTGGHPAYAPIAAKNRGGLYRAPIYVGKAIPAGARKGNVGLDEAPGSALYTRLSDHARSIEQASGLHLPDFACRYIAVDDIWIPLGESLLIERFRPLWNLVLDGFGNHDPGSGRYQQAPSQWDVFHPGRPWALKLQGRPMSAEEIEAAVSKFLMP